jgi:hypothetical protein
MNTLPKTKIWTHALSIGEGFRIHPMGLVKIYLHLVKTYKYTEILTSYGLVKITTPVTPFTFSVRLEYFPDGRQSNYPLSNLFRSGLTTSSEAWRDIFVWMNDKGLGELTEKLLARILELQTRVNYQFSPGTLKDEAVLVD